jgi:hypothetical protein
MRWALPLAAVALVAALVTGAWAITAGGGGAVAGDDDWGGSFGDINPAYSSIVAIPAEEGTVPIALWSLEIDPEAELVEMGSGLFGTLVIENLVEEPLANGTAVIVKGSPAFITEQGDLTANISVTADVYNDLDPTGCILSVNPGTNGSPVAEHSLANPLIRFEDVTVHPGRTVTMQFPIIPGASAISGASYLLKAEVDSYTGFWPNP